MPYKDIDAVMTLQKWIGRGCASIKTSSVYERIKIIKEKSSIFTTVDTK